MTLPPARRSGVVREIRRGRRERGLAHSTFWEIEKGTGYLIGGVRVVVSFYLPTS
jgi:hypothetical protein